MSGQAARLRGGGNLSRKTGCQEGKRSGYNNILSPGERVRERGRKFAFTLSEVLITLGIIGVVAALTMPALLTNVNEHVNSHRQANIVYKITQATDKMKALGLLNGSYTTTDQFVDELQKHLKITKRCDANHIADCWPTDKVTLSDGKTYDVNNAVTGAELKVFSNTTDNVLYLLTGLQLY